MKKPITNTIPIVTKTLNRIVELIMQEFFNLIEIAKQHKELFDYKIVNGIFIVTASDTFLTNIGY